MCSLVDIFQLLAHSHQAFNCTDDENSIALSVVRKQAWLTLRAKIDEQTAEPILLGKLRNHFEERFRYGEGGVPRVWKPEDDIDGAFKTAKDEVFLHRCGLITVSHILDSGAGALIFSHEL